MLAMRTTFLRRPLLRHVHRHHRLVPCIVKRHVLHETLVGHDVQRIRQRCYSSKVLKTQRIKRKDWIKCAACRMGAQCKDGLLCKRLNLHPEKMKQCPECYAKNVVMECEASGLACLRLNEPNLDELLCNECLAGGDCKGEDCRRVRDVHLYGKVLDGSDNETGGKPRWVSNALVGFLFTVFIVYGISFFSASTLMFSNKQEEQVNTAEEEGSSSKNV